MSPCAGGALSLCSCLLTVSLPLSRSTTVPGYPPPLLPKHIFQQHLPEGPSAYAGGFSVVACWRSPRTSHALSGSEVRPLCAFPLCDGWWCVSETNPNPCPWERIQTSCHTCTVSEIMILFLHNWHLNHSHFDYCVCVCVCVLTEVCFDCFFFFAL